MVFNFPPSFSCWLITGSLAQLGHAFCMGGETLSAYIGKLCRRAVLKSFKNLFQNRALFYLLNPFSSAFSCKVISKEFFLASTTGFVAWLGIFSLHLFSFNLIFLSLTRLTTALATTPCLVHHWLSQSPLGASWWPFPPFPRVLNFCTWLMAIWLLFSFFGWKQCSVSGETLKYMVIILRWNRWRNWFLVHNWSYLSYLVGFGCMFDMQECSSLAFLLWIKCSSLEDLVKVLLANDFGVHQARSGCNVILFSIW